MRIAVAIVAGLATGSPSTIGAAPAAWKPHIRGRRRGDAVGGVLAVALPVRGDVAGVADRQAVHVGRAPSASTISNAAVFWPSMRNGLTRVDQRDRVVSASSRASVRQSSKLPSICTSFAPCISACASLPSAILTVGHEHGAEHPGTRRRTRRRSRRCCRSTRR